MKKETFFFLILVMTAAIITGSTLGLMSNVKYISHGMNTSSTKSGLNEGSDGTQVAWDNKKNPAVASQKVASNNNEPSNNSHNSSTLNPSRSAPRSTNEEYMILSPEENDQIKSMLVDLGMPKNMGRDQFLMQFQQHHGISVTGNLDSTTLNTILREVIIQKANRQATQ